MSNSKYLKYKKKYLKLKAQSGGSTIKFDDEIPICSICLDEFNNTNKRPVALHNLVTAEATNSTNEHYVCLECYNNPASWAPPANAVNLRICTMHSINYKIFYNLLIKNIFIDINIIS